MGFWALGWIATSLLAVPGAGSADRLPAPMPPPDAVGPSPERSPRGVPPPPGDPIDFLYSHRVNFAAGGTPLVTLRLMEGQDELRLVGDSSLSVLVRGAGPKSVGVPAGVELRLRLRSSRPARLRYFPEVADLEERDRRGLARARALWQRRGYKVTLRTLGTVYGIGGHILDNRRILVLLGAGGDQAAAQAVIDRVRVEHDQVATLYDEIIERPHGLLEVANGSGGVVAVSQDVAVIDLQDGGATLVKRVEFGQGYDFHGFEDRRYRGRLYAAVDKAGKLALVEALPLEDLLRGLLPKEIFASAPMEALKAQAVTARGEVLAKIGVRHLSDPYFLCAEQHCQVYGDMGVEKPSTDAAVDATRGEALFSRDGRLVDSVYSAVCGGHTEDSDVVWGGLPNPSLRGVSDLEPGAMERPGQTEAELRRWIEATPRAYCQLSGLAAPGKFRWTRRFTAAELDQLLAPLGVGRILELWPEERGSSGRAAALGVVGERGRTEVRGELAIRKLLKNLNSSAFVVDVEAGPDGKPAAFVLEGAGWGHGVGMCQTGAIGRAQRGQSYREILRHYFSGAEVARIY